MTRFAQLYTELDATTRTSEKTAALARYFAEAPSEDAAWAVYFLIGRRPPRPVSSTVLQQWAAELAGIEPWLFGECYDAVGDLAETITLVVPSPVLAVTLPLHQVVAEHLLPLKGMAPETQKGHVQGLWQSLAPPERFVYNKLLTGSFRVGVSRELVQRALAQVLDRPVPDIAHRLMGPWEPASDLLTRLAAVDGTEDFAGKPYPFCLAHPLEGGPEGLGDPSEWSAEWKWDGVRGQAVRRRGQSYLWSRGEELVTDRFPEIATMLEYLPDGTVLDGEILAWREDRPLKFAELQRRIGRKVIGKRLLAEVPVIFLAFDLLEWEGVDVRSKSFRERRGHLEALTAQLERFGSKVAEVRTPATWLDAAEFRERAREMGTEGLMLKSWAGEYAVGRKRGTWWKWKVEPYTVDAVLVYAQRGSGKRASLYTDYTFAVWDEEGKLVPFAKAYSGLDDAEIRKVDAFVRRNTTERFGPVRSVTPQLVMELAFEGIQLSSRHKSGVAVRFPRISRWRHDKTPDQADRLAEIRAMLAREAGT